MWIDGPLLGFDTETTGVDVTRDRTVTASLVYQEGPDTTCHSWLADPGIPIPEAASRIHGITTEQARAEGRPAAEVLEEVAQMLTTHMSQGLPAVAFNASYDFTLLEQELKRHGLATLRERLGGAVFPILDPYLLDRYVDRYRRGKRRLENLVDHYGVGQNDGFHDAETDVLATLRVLRAQAQRFPKMVSMSLEELDGAQREANSEFQAFIHRRRPSAYSTAWPITVD